MLLGIYLFCLALGGVLIAASILLGGHHGEGDHDHDLAHDHDHDLGHDHDHDLGHDHDNDAEHDADHPVGQGVAHEGDHESASGTSIFDLWAALLSVRFWTFALATFGLTGTLLDLLGFSALVSLLVSLPVGLVIGFAVATLFRYLRKATTVGRATDLNQVAGVDGLILLPVGPGKTGKVRFKVQGADQDLPATTREEHLLEPHARVLVVGVRDGVADVVRLPEK